MVAYRLQLLAGVRSWRRAVGCRSVLDEGAGERVGAARGATGERSGCGEARRLVLGDAVDGERTPCGRWRKRRDFWGREVEPSRRVGLDVAA